MDWKKGLGAGLLSYGESMKEARQADAKAKQDELQHMRTMNLQKLKQQGDMELQEMREGGMMQRQLSSEASSAAISAANRESSERNVDVTVGGAGERTQAQIDAANKRAEEELKFKALESSKDREAKLTEIDARSAADVKAHQAKLDAAMEQRKTLHAETQESEFYKNLPQEGKDMIDIQMLSEGKARWETVLKTGKDENDVTGAHLKEAINFLAGSRKDWAELDTDVKQALITKTAYNFANAGAETGTRTLDADKANDMADKWLEGKVTGADLNTLDEVSIANVMTLVGEKSAKKVTPVKKETTKTKSGEKKGMMQKTLGDFFNFMAEDSRARKEQYQDTGIKDTGTGLLGSQ